MPVPGWIRDSTPGQAAGWKGRWNRWNKRLLLCLGRKSCTFRLLSRYQPHTGTQRRWGSALSCKRLFFLMVFFPPMNNFSSTPPQQHPARCGGELSSGDEVVLPGGVSVCLSVCLPIPACRGITRAGRKCVPSAGMSCELCLVEKKKTTWEKAFDAQAAQLSWESSWAKG